MILLPKTILIWKGCFVWQLCFHYPPKKNTYSRSGGRTDPCLFILVKKFSTFTRTRSRVTLTIFSCGREPVCRVSPFSKQSSPLDLTLSTPLLIVKWPCRWPTNAPKRTKSKVCKFVGVCSNLWSFIPSVCVRVTNFPSLLTFVIPVLPIPLAGNNPESNRQALMKKEEDKLKTTVRREAQQRRIKEKQASKGWSRGAMEIAWL